MGVYRFTKLVERIPKALWFLYINQHEEGKHDLRRIKKKSFYWYKEVIESNGENR